MRTVLYIQYEIDTGERNDERYDEGCQVRGTTQYGTLDDVVPNRG